MEQYALQHQDIPVIAKLKTNQPLTAQDMVVLEKLMWKENLIKQDFSAVAPFTKLLTDISQIQCQDGKLYLSPILDCYDGDILALEMRDNMKKELCIDTFKATLKRFSIKGAILHSDRGTQYTSEAFRETLQEAGVFQSLSGVNHCFVYCII